MKKTLLSRKRSGNLLASQQWAIEWELRCLQRATGQVDDEFYRTQFIRYHGGKRSDDVYAEMFERLFTFVDEGECLEFIPDPNHGFQNIVLSEDAKPTELRLDREWLSLKT